MQEQKWWNYYPRSYLKKEKIFWIGSSEIHGTSTHTFPINETLRDGLQNARQINAEQDKKHPPSNIGKSRDVFKREKHLQLAAVEGATCSLQERSNTQERAFPVSRSQFRQKIDVTVGKTEIGQFSPTYHSDVQHLTAGRLSGITTEPNNQVVAKAPSLFNPQPLTHVQKSEATTLHLYLPTAESYEEEEPDTARYKRQVLENNDSSISKNIFKVDPPKALAQNRSSRVIDKWTRVPCKEALSTANLSVQFGGDSKRLHSFPMRCVLDNTKNGFSLSGDTSYRHCIQRPASNIGYRLRSYYTEKIAKNSEYGLNARTLKLNNDKSKGNLLSTQYRELEKGEHFVKNTREHAMNEKPNIRCKSQPDILDVKERVAYI